MYFEHARLTAVTPTSPFSSLPVTSPVPEEATVPRCASDAVTEAAYGQRLSVAKRKLFDGERESLAADTRVFAPEQEDENGLGVVYESEDPRLS